jgi:exodeoxyribonuclease VII large subunit
MNDSTHTLTVSRLVALLKETVEDNFVQVAVEGEISNLVRPASGHLYFTLKDESAQIRAVMFRHASRLLKFSQENGLQVICRGNVSLYQQRGELQLVVEAMDPVGTGSLQLAFEQLKKKLQSEGLFDDDLKREMPPYPKKVGIVTSATGAAVHDILQVFQRRGAGLSVELWPTRVQGDESVAEIVAGIEGLNQHGDVDVIIVGRGGGSLEDLWSFNEESVARAIAASKIPVISAVGHEVDFTIADFVADLRAATPTAAAELVTKSRMELESHIDQLRLRLASLVSSRLELLSERVAGLRRQLISPDQQLKMWRFQFNEQLSRLQRACDNYCGQKMVGVADLAARLDLLSPLKTLNRGYSIVLHESGKAVLDSDQLQPGDLLDVKFRSGEAKVQVKETKS